MLNAKLLLKNSIRYAYQFTILKYFINLKNLISYLKIAIFEKTIYFN
jgi:hypothetical protein